jgi:hypothetical protein
MKHIGKVKGEIIGGRFDGDKVDGEAYICRHEHTSEVPGEGRTFTAIGEPPHPVVVKLATRKCDDCGFVFPNA